MKLTLVRHSSLQITAGICYGQTDVDVSVNFPKELAQLKPKLSTVAFDAIYASPLQRCAKLADALQLGDVVHDERLKELHFGDWEMQAWEDVPRDYFDEWAQNYATMPPPNGETFAELQSRGIDFIQEKLQTHQDHHLLLVTHGGMIRAMLAYVLNMPLKGLFRFKVDYASVTQIEVGGEVPSIGFVNR